MGKLSLSEVRRDLPMLVEQVRQGQRVLITRRGEVVAELRAPQKKKPRSLLKGSIMHIADDFDEPQPEVWNALK